MMVGPYTSRLIDILNNNKAHATFFMLGKIYLYIKMQLRKLMIIKWKLGIIHTIIKTLKDKN